MATKLDERMMLMLEQCVRDGLGWEQAADCVGINTGTFRTWRRQGKNETGIEPETLHAELVRRLAEVETEWERSILKKILDAGNEPRHWTANAWLLERRYPNRYALIKRIETGAPGEFDRLDVEEIDAKILKLVKQPGVVDLAKKREEKG